MDGLSIDLALTRACPANLTQLQDIFSMFFGGGRRGPSGPRKGEDIRHPLKVGARG